MYGGVIALANAAAAGAQRALPASTGKLARTLRARHGLLEDWRHKSELVRDRRKQLIWFHAPSVGEGLQARPVIDLLRATHPEVQIAYSYFSPSAEKFASSLNVDMSGYLPFDSVKSAEMMIDMLAPVALFFSKLDVWPNLVRVAHSRGVKTGLLSATVAPASGRRGTLAGALLRDAYRALDFVGAIDAHNASRLEQLGVRGTTLQVSGDTRFDQVWERAQGVNRDSALLRSLHSNRPTLVAGSTWPADDAVLLPAWLNVRAQKPGARMVIAPHEPTAEHQKPIQEWAQTHNLKTRTVSDLLERSHVDESVQAATKEALISGQQDNSDVIIVDRVGVLGDIYAVADVAFVGGAFHKAGLHSVIEPAAFGLPVVFGPAFHMSREAGLLAQCGGATSVNSTGQCSAALLSYFSNDAERKRAGENAAEFVKSELGAANRSVQIVLRSFERP
ncbi:MAG: hypothetical protein H7Z40_04640 [Phycisphaerae bacterium]|nr:hypothetical protein [Gemmatimonadaceae bacterium]